MYQQHDDNNVENDENQKLSKSVRGCVQAGWLLWCYSSLQALTLSSHWKMKVEYLTNNEELLKHREKTKCWQKWWRILIGWNYTISTMGCPTHFAIVLIDNEIVWVFMTKWWYTDIKLESHLFAWRINTSKTWCQISCTNGLQMSKMSQVYFHL